MNVNMKEVSNNLFNWVDHEVQGNRLTAKNAEHIKKNFQKLFKDVKNNSECEEAVKKFEKKWGGVAVEKKYITKEKVNDVITKINQLTSVSKITIKPSKDTTHFDYKQLKSDLFKWLDQEVQNQGLSIKNGEHIKKNFEKIFKHVKNDVGCKEAIKTFENKWAKEAVEKKYIFEERTVKVLKKLNELTSGKVIVNKPNEPIKVDDSNNKNIKVDSKNVKKSFNSEIEKYVLRRTISKDHQSQALKIFDSCFQGVNNYSEALNALENFEKEILKKFPILEDDGYDEKLRESNEAIQYIIGSLRDSVYKVKINLNESYKTDYKISKEVMSMIKKEPALHRFLFHPEEYKYLEVDYDLNIEEGLHTVLGFEGKEDKEFFKKLVSKFPNEKELLEKKIYNFSFTEGGRLADSDIYSILAEENPKIDAMFRYLLIYLLSKE